jgi:hypothetical protein
LGPRSTTAVHAGASRTGIESSKLPGEEAAPKEKRDRPAAYRFNPRFVRALGQEYRACQSCRTPRTNSGEVPFNLQFVLAPAGGKINTVAAKFLVDFGVRRLVAALGCFSHLIAQTSKSCDESQHSKISVPACQTAPRRHPTTRAGGGDTPRRQSWPE